MTPAEKAYYEELLLELEEGYTFVSFSEHHKCDFTSNLVTQIHSSPYTSRYPLVLCAFLDAAHYKSGATHSPFEEFTPPSLEEVEEMLKDYSGRLPSCLNIFSECGRSDTLLPWNGIQYARFYVGAKTFRNTSYMLTFRDTEKIFHGKGTVPCSFDGSLELKKIVLIDGDQAEFDRIIQLYNTRIALD